MKHIKSYLIHLLGGITKQELAGKEASSYLFLHFRMLNGAPPEEWCRKVYSYITDEIDNIEKSIYGEEEGGDK